MKFKNCPKCGLNYIPEDQELCSVCAASIGVGSAPGSRPEVTHKGRNIFMVFQGKEYRRELTGGYLSAPYKDARGGSPSHWTMLENVAPGDIIFHGLSQCISAISVATSKCFKSNIKGGGIDVRQVNCRPIIIKNTVATKEFLKEIIETCSRYKYQPFDKNGDGRQGYLFDLNDELASVFSRELIKRNSDLIDKIPELGDIAKY